MGRQNHSYLQHQGEFHHQNYFLGQCTWAIINVYTAKHCLITCLCGTIFLNQECNKFHSRPKDFGLCHETLSSDGWGMSMRLYCTTYSHINEEVNCSWICEISHLHNRSNNSVHEASLMSSVFMKQTTALDHAPHGDEATTTGAGSVLLQVTDHWSPQCEAGSGCGLWLLLLDHQSQAISGGGIKCTCIGLKEVCQCATWFNTHATTLSLVLLLR